MKRFLKWSGLILGGLIALFVIVGLGLPKGYQVSRSIRVAAPPARVHALIDDLTRWDQWSPWKDGDPTLVTTLGPVTHGVGANQSWIGKGYSGRLVITASDPATGVAFDLFMDDHQVPDRATIRTAADGADTTVTWAIDGAIPVPVIGGWFALLMPGLIGRHFETGLARIKIAAEKATPATP